MHIQQMIRLSPTFSWLIFASLPIKLASSNLLLRVLELLLEHYKVHTNNGLAINEKAG